MTDSLLPPVHIVLVNDCGISRGFIRRLFSSLQHCPLIIFDHKIRDPPPDYFRCFFKIDHATTGGVTDGFSTFHLFSMSMPLISAVKEQSIPQYPVAGLPSILSRTLSGTRKGFSQIRIPPDICLTSSLPVPSLDNTYYANGLFPRQGVNTPLTKLWFICPCVYPSTPWVRRKLSIHELGQVFDLPSSYMQSLGAAKLAPLMHLIRQPIKPMTALLQHLFFYSWPEAFDNHSSPCNDDDAGGSITGGPDVTGGGALSSQVAVSSIPADDPDTLAERNAVAGKSDDAPIPVYVWRKQLERILCHKIPEDIYERGADHLREKLLRMWRRGLFRHFILWAKSYHTELSSAYKWCTGQFNWTTPVENFQSLKIVYWDSRQCRYRWLSRKHQFNIGISRYKVEWQLRVDVLGKSRAAAKECLEKSTLCSWWKWDGGSRLFFWRWPPEYMKEIRDGSKVWCNRNRLPLYRIPQRPPRDADMIPKMREKLADVISKLYIEKGDVRSLTSFFAVRKGLDDIRMVYNGTSCGLNAACWAPWFPLPTVKTHLRTVESGTWMADIDLGEMFLNFMLDEELREYAGVDVSLFFPELLSDSTGTLWKRWCRLLMGFMASPYLATRCLLRARKILIGDRSNPANPFRWDHVVKNYPGMENYNPLRPKIYKVRGDGEIAADVHKYIDDLRPTACSEDEIWKASMQIMTRVNWLGMQNAARKYRDGALRPGAWAGSIVFTKGRLGVTISPARWLKTKEILNRLLDTLLKEGKFELKQLLSDRGFLTYVSQSYPAMVPYLKGIHLTIDSWRDGRDENGWKVLDVMVSTVPSRRTKSGKEENIDEELKEIGEVVEEFVDSIGATSNQGGVVGPPLEVYPVTRLVFDLKALIQLFAGDEPVVRYVRALCAELVKFGFGDASGAGYGSALARLKGRPNIRHGKWALFYSTENTSSNFRELRNTVDAIEVDHKKGLLDGVELFFFTDNEVAEKAYYKGTSSSQKLFELVLRLRRIEMAGKMIIHVIHISGKRMIACGIDGLSRGDTTEGIAAGITMDNYVPLHKDCVHVERSPKVLDWINSWWPSNELGKIELLSEDDWYIWDERKIHCLWTPAPAGGEAGVEELANWIHHTPDRIHMLVIPTIWTVQWRKQLGRACDCYVTLPNVFEFWNHGNHGGSSFIRSWVDWSGKCVGCKKTLTDPIADIFCGNFCYGRGDFGACYNAWCSSCYRTPTNVEFPRVIPVDDEGYELPCKEEDLFQAARPGDTLLVPFQCELCHFRNVKGRSPYLKNSRDNYTLNIIRRANLDSFWSRTSATVRTNMADFRKFVKHSRKLWGNVPGLPAKGPYAIRDEFGMAIATATLSRSLDPGKNAEFIQFNTARRIRSAYSNSWNASVNTLDTGVMQDGQTKLMITSCPVYHFWYTRMMKGMHERMGDLVVQDLAISRELQVALMDTLENKVNLAGGNTDRWVEIGVYLMLLWLGALRGNEAMQASLEGCIKMMEESKANQSDTLSFGVMVLVGKFKTSTGYTKYLLYLSSKTKSNFKTPFRVWLERLLEVRRRQGHTKGYLFCKSDGSPLEMSHYEVDILQMIGEVQEKTDGIVAKDIDVFDKYGVFRSWRRGATSVARNEGLRKEDIDLNNGWRKLEESRGKHVSSDMLAYYTEDILVIDAKLRFSEVL